MIPTIGFGTWKLQDDEARIAVENAVDTGYRHIDCAHIYGNEQHVGNAFKNKLATGTVTREDLWVTSKLWNDCHQVEYVRPALEKTLKRLQLDYLDLYLIHWPVVLKHGVELPESAADFLSLSEVPLLETWSAMEDCFKAGLCRHIGVSNFNRFKLQHLIDGAETRPFANQVESHPFLQQNDLVDYCHSQDITFVAYSPLGSYDRPDRLKKENEPVFKDNPELLRIAKQRNCSAQQVMLAWAIRRGTIPIPKAANPVHQQQNFEALTIELDDSDMAAIASLDREYRFVDGTFWTDFAGPYTLENLWES